MNKIIHNTIKLYIYNVQTARRLDFVVKRGGVVVGAGIGSRSCYVLFDYTDTIDIINEWNELVGEEDENLIEY